jgi:dienelactone hydrolase
MPQTFRRVACLRRMQSLVLFLLLLVLIPIGGGLRGAMAQTTEQDQENVPNHSPLNEQLIRIPGDAPPAVTLQVTIFRPNGDGPFPLAVMNHAANAVSVGNRGNRYRLNGAAFYFLSRGYAVAQPMMRGYAASGGELYHFGCDLGATATANALDIRAVIRYLGTDPHIDTRNVIVAGQSFGGWNTLAVGALNIPNVKGLINFSGVLRESDCKPGDGALVAAAGALGSGTKAPSIWFYGDNDDLNPTSTWRAMYDRYTAGGGHAELVDVGVFMRSSHDFLTHPESQQLWLPRLDSFLQRIGMPYAPINPDYMPKPFPPATSFAAIDDVAAVPYMSDKGHDFYKKFLQAPFPRVFVINEAGSAATDNGGFDPLGRSLRLCQNRSVRCGIYAVDDRVVWKPFLTSPPERAYSVTVKADQTTTIDFSSRLNPDCSPKAFAKFKIVLSPVHGRLDIGPKDDFPKFPASSPFAACNKNPVHGVAITYTPAKGFLGQDAFSFADDTTPAPAPTLKISLTIK